MSFQTSTAFRKPKKPVALRERKPMNKIGPKGEFWNFCTEIVEKFRKRLGISLNACEIQGAVCDGYNLTWAHTRRRWTIRAKQYDEDWTHALRVVRACGACHYDADSQGGPAAEEILEPIWNERNTRLGFNQNDIARIQMECAAEVQTEFASKGMYQEYEVRL